MSLPEKEFAKPRALPRLLFWLIFGLILFPAAGQTITEEPTLEELAQTEAAQLYISKQYARALEKFEKMEEERPGSVLIKRYIAQLYDLMRRRDKAAEKLGEILKIKKDDHVARRMLGDVYMKEGELQKARSAFQYIVENAPAGQDRAYAEARLNEIQTVEFLSRNKGQAGEKIDIEKLVKSEATRAFQQGRYENALAGFEDLLRQYPQDVLLYRLKGVTLMRLERHEEAVRILESALTLEPDNASVHYYLGQAYTEMQKFKEAREAYRWVIASEEVEYKKQAQRALFTTLRQQEQYKRPWKVRVTNTYEFDTNATFKSNDENFKRPGDQNSGRYKTLLYGTYKLYKKKKLSFTADSFYFQNISNDFRRLNTYTYGVGISGLYGFKVFNKPVYLNIRDGIAHTFLKNKFYVFSNSLLGSLIIMMHPKVQTTLSYQFNVSEYDSSGSFPFLTDRDGFSHTATVGNKFYFNKDKTFYLSAEYYYERHDTEGNNYTRNVNGTEWRLHFPLFLKVEGDINFEFKDSNYLKYGFTPPKRRDDVWTLTGELSYPLTDHLSLTGSYTFQDSRAKNNAFEYTKHVFGVELGFIY